MMDEKEVQRLADAIWNAEITPSPHTWLYPPSILTGTAAAAPSFTPIKEERKVIPLRARARLNKTSLDKGLDKYLVDKVKRRLANEILEQVLDHMNVESIISPSGSITFHATLDVLQKNNNKNEPKIETNPIEPLDF